MPFQPGQSGNPGGRRKKSKEDRDVEALARQLSPEAIRTLREIMRSKKAPASARAGAAVAILDRGYGRPKQSIEATVRRIDPESIPDAELAAYLQDDGGAPDPTNLN
jgi:hypothetical protein